MNQPKSAAVSFSRLSLTSKQPRLLLLNLIVPHVVLITFFLASTIGQVNATSSQGCLFDHSLCNSEEACIQDGLFGQCFAAEVPDSVSPILLRDELNPEQKALLRIELERLAEEGFDWSHDKSQCFLAYFKIIIFYDISYDTEFCSVHNPGNILALIQRIQNYLNENEYGTNAAAAATEAEAELLTSQQEQQVDRPIIIEEIPILKSDNPSNEDDEQPFFQEAIIVDENTGDAMPVIMVDNDLVEQTLQDTPVLLEKAEGLNKKNFTSTGNSDEVQSKLVEASMADTKANIDNQQDKLLRQLEKMSKEDDKQLTQFVTDILNKHSSQVRELTMPQLGKLVNFIGLLENNLESMEIKLNESDEQAMSNSEQEEQIPQTSENNAQQFLIKKDPENFNNEDMGLSNIEHKIVKGNVHRVEGNRVYIKVNKENITENEMDKLITYLDKKIAEPNNIHFDEFQYDNGQLSFRIARFADSTIRKTDKRVNSASRVAQAVYKRRKDIQTLAGVGVDETGIGSGDDVLPLERSERDWLFLPILMVCAFTVTSLIIVLAVHMIKNRRRHYKSNLPEVLDHMNGKSSTAYEELCRQRMNSHDVPLGVTVNKSGSTSSWPDETLLQSCNLDISTGHVILSFLQEYLNSPQKIADQWDSVKDYTNINAESKIGARSENLSKNIDPSVLPYDETIVSLNGTHTGNGYINASKIHDSDLRQVAYIATQAPIENTVNDFWHCIWEQGITLIVNLCDQQDALKYQRYWPDEGSNLFGIFEIHLVSEHIWNEDYLVRSLYLKNTETNETRTVTQFHFLAWSETGIPTNVKSLLEFRRKVNKSYRGRASPVLVHCRTGTARTGAYCLIDIIVNRITKGIKELNIAGSLEHLRDQRCQMVGNLEQYKLAYACVAEEVNSLLKNMQQQQ